MKIGNLDESIEYSGSNIGKSLLKFIRNNGINFIHINSIINFSGNVKKNEHIPMSGKWRLTGADSSVNSFLIFEKNNEKFILDFEIFKELNDKGYLKIINE